MPLPSRVLVVSGDYDASEALTAALHDAGLAADAANDTGTAVDLAARQDYGLVVIEHWPPYLDADRCARRLKRWLRHTPLVILDGPAPTAADPAIRSDVLHVLPRTTTADELATLAVELLEIDCGVPV